LHQLHDVLQEQSDNWFLAHPSLQAQDICQRQVDVGWPRRGVGDFATVQAPKKNPSARDLLSSVSTKNIVCDSTDVHDQSIQLLVLPPQHWVISPNKKHQT
jgi:hypothetical protein